MISVNLNSKGMQISLMIINIILPIFFISLISAYLLTPLVKKIALKIGCIDLPSERKMHASPIPRLGGVAIFLAVIFGVISHVPIDKTILGILCAGTLILAIGILDDIYGMNPWLKLFGQTVAAIMTCSFGISMKFITNPFDGGVIYLGFLSVPLTVIWLVGIMNMINLIDGLDGLAAGMVAISSLIITIVALNTYQTLAAILMIAVVGATIGFLKYNFSPAQIFMGDSGSLFLGYILGVVSIIGVLKSTITISLAVPLLILGIPISDTAFAIFRRFKNGNAIFKPDKGHFHHRLINKGLTQKQVVVLFYVISIGLGIMALIVNASQDGKIYLTLSLVLMIIAGIFIIIRKNQKVIFSFLRLLF